MIGPYGGARRLVSTLALVALGLTAPALAQHKGVGVDVHILVIEASRKGKGVDPQIPENVRAHLERTKYERAVVLDSLKARAESESSVSLEVRGTGDTPAGGAKKQPWMLKVKVLEVKGEEVRLHVAIEAVKFATTTTHKNGGTIVVAHALSEERALYLAVTPKM